MNEMTVDPREPADKFSDQLARKEGEFALALPTDRSGRTLITASRFVRALLTTVSMVPKLLRADRRSFWDAASRCAQDGLLPDGREAALVPFENRRKLESGAWGSVLTVQYIPMVGGYRRLVREAGIDWQLRVVHAEDKFSYVLGDDERIEHVPSDAEDPGPWTHVYAIAKLRNTRASEIIARDVMNRAAVFRIRDRSQGWQSMMRIADEKDRDRAISKSAWSVWEEEMALKTVAKRQVKVLPLSTDSPLHDVLRREEIEERGANTIRTPAIASTSSLAEKMRALADQREKEALEDEDDTIEDIDQDGDVVDKSTGEITRPEAVQSAVRSAALSSASVAPEVTGSSPSSSQKAADQPASGATNAAVQAEQNPQPVTAQPAAATAPAAPPTPPTAAAGAGPVMKLTVEQAKAIRKLAEVLMGAQSQRSVQKGVVNFLEDQNFVEGSEAEAAVVAIRDIHLQRVIGKSSPAECDHVRDQATKL